MLPGRDQRHAFALIVTKVEYAIYEHKRRPINQFLFQGIGVMGDDNRRLGVGPLNCHLQEGAVRTAMSDENYFVGHVAITLSGLIGRVIAGFGPAEDRQNAV